MIGTDWIVNLGDLEEWATRERDMGVDVYAFAWEERNEFRRLARIFIKNAPTADILNFSLEGRTSIFIINNLQITHLW